VRATGARLPWNRAKTLMKAKCATNSGQRVGVSVKTRSSRTHYKLLCRVSKNRIKRAVRTSHGNGSRMCRQGQMQIRARGRHSKMTIIWGAPAIGTYSAYSLSKTYRK
jgi:hypothetical protein